MNQSNVESELDHIETPHHVHHPIDSQSQDETLHSNKLMIENEQSRDLIRDHLMPLKKRIRTIILYIGVLDLSSNQRIIEQKCLQNLGKILLQCESTDLPNKQRVREMKTEVNGIIQTLTWLYRLQQDINVALERGEKVQFELNENMIGQELLFQAGMFYRLGRFALSIKFHSEFLKVVPTSEDGYNGKGIALKNLRKYQDCIKCYDESLRINPNNQDSYCNKGIALLSMQKIGASIKYFDQCLSINTNHDLALNYKGQGLITIKKFDEANQYLERCLRINQKFYHALNNKGDSLCCQQYYKEAAKCYDQCLNLNPNNRYALKKMVYLLCSHYEDAIKYYDEYLKFNQYFMMEYFSFGRTVYIYKRYQRALIIFDQYLNFNPKYASAYLNKGRCLHLLGNYDESSKTFDKYFSIASNNQLCIGNIRNIGNRWHKYKEKHYY